MLSKEEVMDRYRTVRGYTASITGTDIILGVEDATKELAQSHLEALEEIEKIKELIIKAEKTVREVIRHFEN